MAKYRILSFFSLLAVFVVSASFNVAPVHAGFFSDVTSFLKGDTTAAAVSTETSQQMPILQAPLNSGGVQVLGTTTHSATVAPVSLSVQDIPTSQIISTTTSPAPSVASTVSSTYTIVSGDNLLKIAEKFNISLNTLLSANNLTSKSVLKIGQKVTIPGVAPSSTTAATSTPSTPSQPTTPTTSSATYKVASGDTLSGIAQKYGVSVTALKAANNLTKNTLSIGEKLTIPGAGTQVKDSVSYSPAATPAAPAPAPVQQIPQVPIMMPASAAKIFSPDGYFMRPIIGGEKTQGIHGHNAVDLAEQCGTPIYASATGTTSIADMGGWDGGYGNYVQIDHSNGSQTLYAHMQTLMVSLGQAVVQGQQIGTIGNTGDVDKDGGTGCHVHFEIHNNGYANPF